MRRKMIKKMALLSAFALMSATVMYGCGGGAAKNASEQASVKESGSAAAAEDVTKVADRLKNEIKYDDKLDAPDTDTVYDILYPGLAKDKVKAMKVYVSSSGGTAEEVAAFEASDEEAAKEIEAKLNERITNQKASFENYVPEELKRLEKAFVVRKGNYVYLSVSADPDKAKSIIG